MSWRIACGASDLFSALLLACGVFMGLPARWWPIDAGAIVLTTLLVAAGMGLLLRAPWGERVAWIASSFAVGIGLVLVTVLALTASYLRGIYGPVGRGGALIFVLVAALLVPYLVVFPALQLAWLGAEKERRRGGAVREAPRSS